MLSIYAKWKGNQYLRATLRKVLERLMLTSHDLDLELDPARVDSQEELQKNAVQLQIVAKVFMDDICASSLSVPASFRKICSIVSSSDPESETPTMTRAYRYLTPSRLDFPTLNTPRSEPLCFCASSALPLLRLNQRVWCRVHQQRKCVVVSFSSPRSYKISRTTSSSAPRSPTCSR